MPPKEGLHEHTPRLEREGVTRAVAAPERAEAAEASVPACPPPITTTSYVLLYRLELEQRTPGIGQLAYRTFSLIVANERRKPCVDRTRGLWPHC